MQTSPRAIVAASASASRRPASPRGMHREPCRDPAGSRELAVRDDDHLVPLGQACRGERVELRAQDGRVAGDEQDAGVDRHHADS